MFSLLATVLEIDRKPDGNTLTLGFPDTNGDIISRPFSDDDQDILALKPGTLLSLVLVPMVPACHGSASRLFPPNALGLVPADHPAVMSPDDASTGEVAIPREIEAATPSVPAPAQTASPAPDEPAAPNEQ